MTSRIPQDILDALDLAHASWRPALKAGLDALVEVEPIYLTQLVQGKYLPTDGRMFAAFATPLDAVRYVLVGEGPYPREESATGVCFMDGAVGLLWSEKGLSKQVNRATSLRNFMKMLLVADKQLEPDNTSGDALAHISLKARAIGSDFVQTLSDLQTNLTRQGFLLLNASLVFRPEVPPARDAKAWQPFMRVVFDSLLKNAHAAGHPPTLVLWGKIAEQLHALPIIDSFPKVVSEHPYNLSFILNAEMHALFQPMHMLKK
jgi:uracil-DNA glycosylase